MVRFQAAAPNSVAVQQLEVLVRTALFQSANQMVAYLLQQATDRIDAAYQPKPGWQGKGAGRADSARRGTAGVATDRVHTRRYRRTPPGELPNQARDRHGFLRRDRSTNLVMIGDPWPDEHGKTKLSQIIDAHRIPRRVLGPSHLGKPESPKSDTAI
jgi:hypothetical protein